MISMLWGHVLNGVTTGGLYVTIALGLSLVAGVMRLLNLAQGEILGGAVYLLLVLSQTFHVDPLIALVGVVPIIFAVAYFLQRSVLQALVEHGGEGPLVATFGISIAAQAVFLLSFGPNPVALEASYGLSGITIFGHRVRLILVMALILGVLLTWLTHLILTRLTFGKALRAAAEDPMAAASLGVNVRHVFALSFGLGAALTAVGALVVGVGFSIDPTSGFMWLLRAVTVVVLGGMGSIWGTLAAGTIVGLGEEFGVALSGPEYRDLIVFVMLVAILIVRPAGLFGKPLR
jgi:branched-chain amino acid transport system permease protein